MDLTEDTAFISALEIACGNGDANFVNENLPRLQDVMDRLQRQGFELAHLQYRGGRVQDLLAAMDEAPEADAEPADDAAVETLAKLFPARQICVLPAVDLVWGLGAFHCLTQQEAALLD